MSPSAKSAIWHDFMRYKRTAMATMLAEAIRREDAYKSVRQRRHQPRDALFGGQSI